MKCQTKEASKKLFGINTKQKLPQFVIRLKTTIDVEHTVLGKLMNRMSSAQMHFYNHIVQLCGCVEIDGQSFMYLAYV